MIIIILKIQQKIKPLFVVFNFQNHGAIYGADERTAIIEFIENYDRVTAEWAKKQNKKTIHNPEYSL